jgi:AcrR family transcriptional regulator
MPKVVDHAQYRKDLLVRCFDLFADRGYAAITMRQIAQGLGVSTGTLYHYFPSKDVLFAQMVEEMMAQDLLQVEVILQGAATLEDRIDRSFQFLEGRVDYFFKQTCVFVDFYQQQRREGKDPMATLKQACNQVEQAIGGLLGITDPHLMTFCMSLWDGLILQSLYEEDRVDFAVQAKLLSKLIVAESEARRSPTAKAE